VMRKDYTLIMRLVALEGGVILAEDKEILDEIDRLREDVRQLREVVNILVNVVMEEDLEEDEEEFPAFPTKDSRFNMYN
jgi:hypothetical protein